MAVAHRLIPHHGYDWSEHQHQQARGDADTQSGECDGEHEDGRGASQKC